MKFAEQKEKGLSELLTVLWSSIERYWRAAIAPAIVVLALGLLVAFKIPSYFNADFLIFIQPQKITTNLTSSPDRDEMRQRLETLVQEILARPRLRAIIEEFKLYPELRGPIGKEKAVSLFRQAYTMSPAQSATGEFLDQTFRFSYTHESAQTAFKVADAISNLFREESLLSRRVEIKGTTEFLDAELNEKRQALERTEKLRQDFIKENFDQLPSHLDAALLKLESAQSQLVSNRQTINANTVRRSNFEREYKELKALQRSAPPSLGQEATSGDPKENLAQLESALLVLQSRYSPRHPDVVNTQKRIQALRQQIRSGAGPKRPAITADSIAARQVRRRMEEVDVQNAALEAENKALNQRIEDLEKSIRLMPVKEQELIKLTRDYEITKKSYESVLAERQKASYQESLVRSQKATQFRIIEPAEMPLVPAGPNRLLIVAASLVAACVVFIGIPLAGFFINKAYKFTDDIESELEIGVIGVIPPMVTPATVRANRRIGAISSFLSLGCLVLGGGVIIWMV